MVSNVLNMDAAELLVLLQRFAADYKDDPDYVTLRAELPAEWQI
jgi:hypothetical protein